MAKRKFGRDDDLDKIMSAEGRLEDTTVKGRKAVLDKFKAFIANNGEESFEELLEPNEDSKKRLEKAMVKYLANFTVKNKSTGKEDVPKGNTLNSYISNLKCALSELTNYNFADKNGKFLRIYSDLKIQEYIHISYIFICRIYSNN